MEKRCKWSGCGKELVRGADELKHNWEKRETCNRTCAAHHRVETRGSTRGDPWRKISPAVETESGDSVPDDFQASLHSRRMRGALV